MQNARRLATDLEIASAASLFWGVFSDKFPEIVTGDSQISGEDEAALAIWANNDPGERPVDMIVLPLPSEVSVERLTQVVSDAMEMAQTALPGTIDENRVAAFKELASCARHVIHFNYPKPAMTGTFIVDIYDTEEDWDACKGPSNFVDGITDFADAVREAENSEYAGAFQVTIKAEGEHEEHEPGEVVYKRFERDIAPTRRRP